MKVLYYNKKKIFILANFHPIFFLHKIRIISGQKVILETTYEKI